jgi:hypothetical protein
MTTFQRTTVIVAIVISLGVAVYEAHRASTLDSELQVLQGQNASLTAQTQQQESKREDTEHRAELLGNVSTAVNPELLRLRGEVALLRQQLAAAKATTQPATNQILFTHPVLPRAEWSDHGTDKPLNAILTMFWALRQGDESKLEQMVWRDDSQTLEDLTFRRDDWDRISAIQVATKLVVTHTAAADSGTVEVIVEKAPAVDGADKDVDIHRWILIKMNGQEQWRIRNKL